VVRPYYSIPRKGTVNRMKTDLSSTKGRNFETINVILQSYFGYLKHVNGFNERRYLESIVTKIYLSEI
jgi:hypothetical protein